MSTTKINANSAVLALRRALHKDLQAGRQLASLAEEMTEAIVANDAARVSELEVQQRLCIEQHTLQEAERRNAARDLAFALGLERVPTLPELIAALPPREQDILGSIRTQILDTEERLVTLNARNRVLLENALEFFRFALEALTTETLRPARYGTNLAVIAAPTFYLDSKA